ncbi:AbfB domain-containing protein [Actinokineospora pegani]|uniref:AbfB domain-containing protein n=1 Tax=Actinokineospora pegani TaxID=2654637 RepID=UPI0012E99807|nr:AbfB domain-containing protein [Actinokineospora pegani]
MNWGTRPAAAAAAAVLLAGTLAVVAEATPAAPGQQAPSQQAQSESTIADKVAAAAVLGIVAGDDLLVLRDRDFVFAVWQRATGDEVRASAELAFAGSAVESTQFIKNGLREAHARDQARQIRDAEIARQAREVKQAAAALLGIVAEPSVLIQSDRDFVFLLWQRATTPKIKAGALAAYNGTAEDRTAFLTGGLLEARRQDQEDAIAADQQADVEERARLSLRAAKSRAAAVIRVVADEGMLVQPDGNFVFDLWQAAPANSEVQAGALEALRGSAEDVRTYIVTGIHDANRLDLLAALREKAESDRRQVLAVQAAADNSKVRPRLAAAARAALAGSDSEVSRFLRVGQYDHLVQSLEATTGGVREWFVRRAGGSAQTGVIGTGTLTPGPGDGADASWKVVTGLADPACFSFESVTQPGYYLRVQTGAVLVVPADGSDQFRAQSTWCVRAGRTAAGVSLESKANPGKYLRHYQASLYVASGAGGQSPWETPAYYTDDATWKIAGVDPTTTGIGLRYANDDGIRAQLGTPRYAEVVDGGVRYRDYATGRLYWTEATGARAMWGLVHAEYLRVGGHRNARLGAPVNDETGTGNGPAGMGRFNHFAAGGSIYYSAGGGTHAVYGPIRSLWRVMGWEYSYLGFPSGDEVEGPGGKRQDFMGGHIEWDAVTGAVQAVRR